MQRFPERRFAHRIPVRDRDQYYRRVPVFATEEAGQATDQSARKAGMAAQQAHQPEENTTRVNSNQHVKIPIKSNEQSTREQEQPEVKEQSSPQSSDEVTVESAPDWQGVAARLQADMDNFRRRQKRQAEEAATQEKARVLRRILPVVDNLTRALNQDPSDGGSLRHGVELTHREFIRFLEAEGVARIETIGHKFDPNLHEAMAAVPGASKPDTIVEEVEAGYTLDGNLLRPAKVVVAA